MAEKKKGKTGQALKLGFGFERKRIKREVILPPMCKDYEPGSFGLWCTKAKRCKNATSSTEGKAGGTDPEEIERRQKRQLQRQL